ncbi:MAG: DUF1559 domain-containing protein, partial [Planctomycetota bacterium]
QAAIIMFMDDAGHDGVTCAQVGVDPRARPTHQHKPRAERFNQQGAGGRGMNWAWGAMSMTGMHTIRPPNAEMCEAHWYDNVGTCPPSSRHQGGVHVLMGDGAVIFLTDSIEAGEQRAPVIGARLPGDVKNRPGKKSPYGLWGALGSRGAKESIEEQLNQ